MWIAQTIADLRQARKAMTGKVALVPTMGGLHRGHLSLIEKAHDLADAVLVSIYVNPTQFGPHEDFASYPRSLDADLQACRDAKVAGVFAPADEEIYPPRVPACELTVPALTVDLEAAQRPGHFAGVCRVVAKLFHLCQPQVAVFGQKDLQQLRVIQAMAADLNLPVAIAASPTVRESDGLAMSTRNKYLDAEQRKHALGLSRALEEARSMILDRGEIDPATVEQAMHAVMTAHHLVVDYAVIRHSLTLAPLDTIDLATGGQVAAVVAGRLGATRLLDNVLIGE